MDLDTFIRSKAVEISARLTAEAREQKLLREGASLNVIISLSFNAFCPVGRGVWARKWKFVRPAEPNEYSWNVIKGHLTTGEDKPTIRKQAEHLLNLLWANGNKPLRKLSSLNHSTSATIDFINKRFVELAIEFPPKLFLAQSRGYVQLWIIKKIG